MHKVSTFKSSLSLALISVFAVQSIQECARWLQQVYELCAAWLVGPKKYYPKDADSKLSVVWLILVQPLLFGAIGIEIDFRLIQGSLIWKTVIILALGNHMAAGCTVTELASSYAEDAAHV